MLSRFLAGVLCAAGLLTATCVDAAPGNRSRQAAASSGESPFTGFFSALGGAFAGRTTVDLPGKHPAGTIIVHTRERKLYFALGNGQAIRYGIGVGREGFTWSGITNVSAKREWPDWTPPEEMLRRRPDLPRHMAGGRDNPLGARALYLGTTMYRIHGSNEMFPIGTASSSGCIRMTNDDVIDLYNRVRIGATVIVR